MAVYLVDTVHDDGRDSMAEFLHAFRRGDARGCMMWIHYELGEKTIAHFRRNPLTKNAAEDLAQDVFRKVWEALLGYRRPLQDPKKVYAWYWAIVRRTATDHLREAKVDGSTPEDDGLFAALAGAALVSPDEPGSPPGWITLSAVDQLIVGARLCRDYSNSRIAAFLFCRPDRVKKRIQRALEKLRNATDPSGAAPVSPLPPEQRGAEEPRDLPGIPESDRWIDCVWSKDRPARPDCEARLRRLSLEQQILVLNHCEGRSPQELANFLGWDLAQVQQQIALALLALREDVREPDDQK